MAEQMVRAVRRPNGVAGAILSARERALREIDGIVGLLHETRGAIGDLQNVLTDLLAKAGGAGDARDPLTLIGDQLGSLVGSLAQISDQLGAGRVTATCLAIGAQTRDIGRSGLQFQMVAKLTAITVASLPARSVELETYAGSFADITQRLSQVSLEVEAQLGRVLAARLGALAEFGAAGAELDRCHETLVSEIGRTRHSGSRDLEIEIGAAAGALQESARSELGKLVGAIQFADAFAQRAEHIATALALADASQGGRARALRRVGLALAEDLIGGMRATAVDLRASIARLAEESGAANAVLEAKLNNGDLEKAIAERERSLARAAEHMRQIGPRIDGIERRSEEIEGMSAAASRSLGDLVDISRQIMVSSVNAGLIASRISSSGGPLTVLAAAAQSQALGCSKRIEECSFCVGNLIATMNGLHLDRVRQELDAVTGTAARLGGDARDSEEAMSARSSLSGVAPRIAAIVGAFSRIGREVTERLAGVEKAMTDFDSAVEPVRAAEMRLSAPEIDPRALDDFRAIFTMQSERDIHDRTLGLAPQEAVAMAGAEDLDDIFF